MDDVIEWVIDDDGRTSSTRPDERADEHRRWWPWSGALVVGAAAVVGSVGSAPAAESEATPSTTLPTPTTLSEEAPERWAPVSYGPWDVCAPDGADGLDRVVEVGPLIPPIGGLDLDVFATILDHLWTSSTSGDCARQIDDFLGMLGF